MPAKGRNSSQGTHRDVADGRSELEASIAALAKDAISNANCVVTVIDILKPSSDQAVLIRAVRAANVFFHDAFDRVEEGVSEASTPQAVYRNWLERQLAAFEESLCNLLQPDTSAQLQVQCLAALMACTRLRQAGVFNGALFRRLLRIMLTSKGVKPEVHSELLGRYAGFADVRLHALRCVSALAQALGGEGGLGVKRLKEDSDEEEQGAKRHRKEEEGATRHGKEEEGAICNGKEGAGAATNGVSRGSAVEGRARRSGGDIGSTAVGGGGGGVDVAERERRESGREAGSLSAADSVRHMFDVLSHVAPAVPDKAEEMTSWCGAAEAGAVAPAGDPSLSSAKRRRLRKRAAPAGVGGAGGRTAAWANARVQRRAYGDAWLALLRLPLPDDIYKKVLLHLHSRVLPVLSEPLLLSDFLTRATDRGGLEGMLALNSLFVLVTRHGLEYPRFYERLYAMLTADAFAAKHRPHFFRLADVFLSSPLVPAYTAASFAKRFARLALTAPPGGAMLALAFVHNLVRRHPALMLLLRRVAPKAEGSSTAAADAGGSAPAASLAGVYAGEDVFDDAQPDPSKTRAVESCLWEVAALRGHVIPTVASFVSVLDKDLSDRSKTAEVDIEPLLTSSYSSLFEHECSRRLKTVPLSFYPEPQQSTRPLFSEEDAADFSAWTREKDVLLVYKM